MTTITLLFIRMYILIQYFWSIWSIQSIELLFIIWTIWQRSIYLLNVLINVFVTMARLIGFKRDHSCFRGKIIFFCAIYTTNFLLFFKNRTNSKFNLQTNMINESERIKLWIIQAHSSSRLAAKIRSKKRYIINNVKSGVVEKWIVDWNWVEWYFVFE